MFISLKLHIADITYPYFWLHSDYEPRTSPKQFGKKVSQHQRFSCGEQPHRRGKVARNIAGVAIPSTVFEL